MAAVELTQVSTVYGSSTDTSTVTEAARKDLGTQEVFIELMMAQMKNQDPLDPMDNQEFLSQLAQLSTVEQLRTANTNLETMQLYESSINNAQSVSLIGKLIKADGDTIDYDGESDTDLSFDLDGAATTARVTVYDEEGVAVRTMELTHLEAGANVVEWDGMDNDGLRAASGQYTFTVTAADADGNAVGATTFISGVVTGVTFEDGVPMLHIGSQQVTMGEIIEVSQE